MRVQFGVQLYNLLDTTAFFMKKANLFLMLLICCNTLIAQNNFKTNWYKTNPIKDENNIGTLSSIKSHQIFLKNAIKNQNELYELYGILYLYKDYSKQTDFVTATNYLLKAERIAKNSHKPGWIGIVKGFRATLTAIVDNNQKLSIQQFTEAIQNCAKANDSLCMGESYEQISTKYSALGDYKKAEYYFKIGVKLLRKFGDAHNMAAAYSNYSTVLFNEKRYDKATIYIDSAIGIALKNKLLHSEMVFRSNSCAIHMALKEYEKALSIINYCEPINIKNNWKSNVGKNYYCKSVIYENKGDYKLALEYLYKYYDINDKVIGDDVKSKIATLVERSRRYDEQLNLKKSELKLEKSQRAQERYAWISLLLLSFVLIGLWMWRRQNLRNKKELAENQKSLSELTNLLIQKNALLLEKEEEFNRKNKSEFQSLSTETDAAFYNQRILTDSDWSSFKESFEKAYPNYIAKLRNSHPAITEAEERLFLCLKLNLRTKETASMLGISNDSVKKNRSRLRKRLSLEAENDLAEYVKLF